MIIPIRNVTPQRLFPRPRFSGEKNSTPILLSFLILISNASFALAQNQPDSGTPVTINFDELPLGALVTNQYVPRVYFSATGFRAGAGGPNGSDLYADTYLRSLISDINFYRNVYHQVSGFSDVYVSFTVPVNNLSFNVLNVCHCYIPYGSVNIYVYTNQQFYGGYTVYFQHAGTNAITFLQTIPNITDIRIAYPSNPNLSGYYTPLYYDDFNFTPNLGVNITSSRVSGSLNGTTKSALLGADIILNAELAPANSFTSGGSYAWSFTGPYSLVGAANSSSVKIRSTGTGIVTAKVTYTKNGYTATGQMTINAVLPSVVSFQATQHADTIAGPGLPCADSDYQFQVGCPAPSPPPSGVEISARLSGPDPMISEPAQSGVKLVHLSSRNDRFMLGGNLMCAISSDQFPSAPYQLESDPLPHAFHTFVNDVFDLTAEIDEGETLANENEGVVIDEQFEEYAVYYVSDNGSPINARLTVTLSKLHWNWGGVVGFDPNGFWNIRTHYGPSAPTYFIFGTSTDSMLPTHGELGPALIQCPGTPSTNYQVDGQRFFVEVLYSALFVRNPDYDGGRYWTSEITQCLFDFDCIHVRRTDIAYAFFLSPETIYHHPELANPPGTPGVNPSFDDAFVLDCYLLLLQRDPRPDDLAGLNWWKSRLPFLGYRGMVEEFINSFEFHEHWH